MPGLVSLDVLPTTVSPEYAAEMVSACTEALAAGQCALAASLPESAQPEAVAIVLWQDESLLRVTIRVSGGDGQWTVRSVTFSDRDSFADRWTTVGLTVATLVGGATDGGASSTPLDPSAAAAVPPASAAREPSVPSSKPPATPARDARESTNHPRASLAPPPRSVAAGALAGPGWDRGGTRIGGWVSVGLLIPKAPIVVYASGSYSTARGPTVNDSAVSSRFLTAAVGAGIFGTWPALSLTGTAGVELAYRRILVTYQGRDLSDAEVPVNLRILGSYPAQGNVAAIFGGTIRLPPQGSGETAEYSLRGPTFSAEALAGLELRL